MRGRAGRTRIGCRQRNIDACDGGLGFIGPMRSQIFEHDLIYPIETQRRVGAPGRLMAQTGLRHRLIIKHEVIDRALNIVFARHLYRTKLA